jgi:hypothetical protein
MLNHFIGTALPCLVVAASARAVSCASLPTLGGVHLAPEKARTAALFRGPSSALEDAINGHRPGAATARGFVMTMGGPNIQLPAHAASSSPHLAVVPRAPAPLHSL